jgi:DNA-directed RNA polymerase I, II, and III subunit RPABC1
MATATQNSSSTISHIYKSRKIILELMKTQGYNIDEFSDFSINEVNTMFQNKQLDLLLEQSEEHKDTHRKSKIYIRYYLAKKLSDKNIQEIIDDLFNLEEILTKDDTLMIIIKDDINETLTNLLKHIWETDGILIIIQSIKRLQFNILNHAIVPNHRILSYEEVNQVKIKYNIKDNTEFPDISRFDPVAQIIGIRPGQICEIIRPSKTAITGLYYRVCV